MAEVTLASHAKRGRGWGEHVLSENLDTVEVFGAAALFVTSGCGSAGRSAGGDGFAGSGRGG